MVADGGDVEVQLVHGLDGRLVVEQPGEQRAGADHVAGRGGDGVGVALAGRPQGLREVLGTARRHGLLAAVRLELLDRAGGALRRFEVAVEVVEGEQLDVDRAAVRAAAWPVVGAGRQGGGGEPGGGGQYGGARSSICGRCGAVAVSLACVPLVAGRRPCWLPERTAAYCQRA